MLKGNYPQVTCQVSISNDKAQNNSIINIITNIYFAYFFEENNIAYNNIHCPIYFVSRLHMYYEDDVGCGFRNITLKG